MAGRLRHFAGAQTGKGATYMGFGGLPGSLADSFSNFKDFCVKRQDSFGL